MCSEKIKPYGHNMTFWLNNFILGSMNNSFFITIAIFIFRSSTLVNWTLHNNCFVNIETINMNQIKDNWQNKCVYSTST